VIVIVIAQILSRELSVNLKLWMENDWCCEGCTFFHCPELGMRIRFTKHPCELHGALQSVPLKYNIKFNNFTLKIIVLFLKMSCPPKNIFDLL
jgi:hypothetical protein